MCGVLLGVGETSFALQLPAPVSIASFTASAAAITRHDLCGLTLSQPPGTTECLISRSLSLQMATMGACLESCCAPAASDCRLVCQASVRTLATTGVV